MNFLQSIGKITLEFIRSIGRLCIFMADAVVNIVRPPFYWRHFGTQLIRIGFFSLPVVGLTAFFTGGALALQTYIATARYGAQVYLPVVVLVGMTRELGPVIAGLMVAGRVSAAIAAELGTMRVTEQIDALATLSTNPVRYLVVPRIVAAVIAMPILVAIADIIGIFGGYVVGTESLDFTGSIYLKTTIDALSFPDVFSGLVKAAVFGFLIALMGSYHGYHTRGGAQGVGFATTNAVVSASILILAANYLLTSILF